MQLFKGKTVQVPAETLLPRKEEVAVRESGSGACLHTAEWPVLELGCHSTVFKHKDGS